MPSLARARPFLHVSINNVILRELFKNVWLSSEPAMALPLVHSVRGTSQQCRKTGEMFVCWEEHSLLLRSIQDVFLASDFEAGCATFHSLIEWPSARGVCWLELWLSPESRSLEFHTPILSCGVSEALKLAERHGVSILQLESTCQWQQIISPIQPRLNKSPMWIASRTGELFVSLDGVHTYLNGVYSSMCAKAEAPKTKTAEPQQESITENEKDSSQKSQTT